MFFHLFSTNISRLCRYNKGDNPKPMFFNP